ncbi:MAG: diaminopimelate epimerase [Gemmatimonadales bacterium]|nr:diaminopimelate epimerase [Gemmatimonadales bacterium]
MMRFRKMHGAGNDFIMLDGRDLPAKLLSSERIAALCHRRLGIGADGLIILLPGNDPGVDFRMSYYNADGREAEMCGNGARCSVAFAGKMGWIDNECRFVTESGILTGKLFGPDDVEISLPTWRDLMLERTVADSPWTEHHSCNTGVPHLVIPVADVDSINVERYGRQFRYQAEFAPAGTNVNWVGPSVDRTAEGSPIFQIRTYERGVEAETLACGTGASASAVILCRLGRAESPVALRARSGDLLRVTVDAENDKLLLRGPARFSFQGEVAR